MPNEWFTADLHFGHGAKGGHSILEYTNRPWATIEAMDAGLIERWNSRIGRHDTVWVIGDFSFYEPEKTARIFAQLHGSKRLIRGNHDKSAKNLQWASVQDIHYLRTQGHRFVLLHYPMLTWQNAHRGVYHLHGHSHGRLIAPESTRLDVGVDTNDCYPYSLDEVVAILSRRRYHIVDHHDATTPEGKVG